MSNRVIFVVSDSVGETAELVVKAALSQFDGGSS
ncbi:phosphoenolpyruvate synthase regulatory protein, partial [Escherichia coli]|nr:phosphoenolpyruvate synthase regulatory protein [Escherichia coli]